METGLPKAHLIAELTKSVHAGGAAKRKKGEKLPKLTPEQKIDAQLDRLKCYVPTGTAALADDEHFFSRLVAWNHQKGQVRDAKIALPVIGLGARDPELLESNLAHLADLRPREFKRAVLFAKALGVKRNVVRRLVARWLTDLAAEPWDRVASLHRETLKWLVARHHLKLPAALDDALFKRRYEPESRFAALKGLSTLPPEVIATAIRLWKFPWLQIDGALGGKLKDPDILAATISAMTPSELVNNMARLETLGVKDHALTRAALDQALGQAATRKGASKNLLKASVAAEAVQDEVLSGKLKALQEQQLDMQKGIDGDWLVLGDMSPSMQKGVEKAKEVAAVLTRLVKGEVVLVFFNATPTSFNVTGKTLDEIRQMTRFIKAGGGGTRAIVGLQWAAEHQFAAQGIAIIGDGGENSANEFAQGYRVYANALHAEPTVYFYKLAPGKDYAHQRDVLSGQLPDMTVFDLRGGVDSYSLPNVVQTMRVSKWSLIDEVLATPLRTLDEVLPHTTTMPVLARKVQDHEATTK